MRQLLGGLVVGCLGYSSLAAVIYCEMETTQPLRCAFSSNHPNRIMVKGQGIDKIIHAEPERLQILIEDKAKQAFIIARMELLEPITLSVITNRGEVQDLEVTFEPRPAELVILKDRHPLAETKDAEKISSSCCQMQSIITSLLKGQVPQGFCEVEFAAETYWRCKRLQITETTRFEKIDTFLRVFRITNSSKMRQTLHERELACENCAWVFLENNCLAPGESVVAILAIQRDA